jgi:hypothetical protein
MHLIISNTELPEFEVTLVPDRLNGVYLHFSKE